MLLTMTTGMAAHGSVTKASFGTMPDGTAVDVYTLKSDAIEARITTYGARLVSLQTADKNGNMGNVVLDLKSGGKAIFTLMGESMPCKYSVKDEKLVLDCTPQGEKVDFVIHGDGSISGPGFIGSMKKSK